MSSPIWTPDALASEFRRHEGRCWRLVEAQNRVSTLRLTDTLDEQALLEELIDDTKPPIPPECRHLDYLLATPFRYGAVYPHGSRFRRAGRTAGVFYGALAPTTAVAEVAFYRLLFYAESPDTPWPTGTADYTGFAAEIATDRLLDLTAPPLARDEARWGDLTDYEHCQAVADTARTAGCGVILYRSVRDPGGGANLAVLACAAFSKPYPVERQTWRLRFGSHGVQALCEHPRLAFEFAPDAFAADIRIAALNWTRAPKR